MRDLNFESFLYRGTSLTRNRALPWDPTLGLCLWSYDGPRGGWRFLMSEVPLYTESKVLYTKSEE